MKYLIQDILSDQMSLDIIPFEVFTKSFKSGHYVLLFDVSKDFRLKVCNYISSIDRNSTERPNNYVSSVNIIEEPRNSLSFLKWLKFKGFVLTDVVFGNAALSNQIEICSWLHINKCPYNSNISSKAARNGNLSLCQWFNDNNYKLSQNISKCAANSGHLDIIKWASAIGILPDDYTYYHASKRGDIKMLEWLYKHYGTSQCNHICSGAVMGNHFETLKWLIDRKFKWDLKCFEFAVEREYLDILQYLYELDPSCDSYNLIIAAHNGYLPIVQWFDEKKYRLNDNVCSAAAESGNLELLQWLYEQGCKFNEEACINAVIEGTLENIKWLYSINSSQGFWDEDMVSCTNGKLELLQWFHLGIGIKLETWSEDVFERIIMNVGLETLQWLHNNAELSTHILRDELNFIAVRYEQYDILCWLNKNGYTWTTKLCTYAAGRNINILTFLLSNNCPMDDETKDSIN